MIWYLDHSAIAVETNNHLLLFDLFGKTLQPPKEMGLAQGFVNPDELRDKDVVSLFPTSTPTTLTLPSSLCATD